MRNLFLDVNASDASPKSPKTAMVASSALVAGVASSPIVFAASGISELFDAIKDLLKDVFDGVDGIITGATVTVIGVGFLIRIFSKNQRTVDEATTWIKRAVMTFIVWKFLGLFMGTITGAADGNDFNWE